MVNIYSVLTIVATIPRTLYGVYSVYMYGWFYAIFLSVICGKNYFLSLTWWTTRSLIPQFILSSHIFITHLSFCREFQINHIIWCSNKAMLGAWEDGISKALILHTEKQRPGGKFHLKLVTWYSLGNYFEQLLTSWVAKKLVSCTLPKNWTVH